MPSPLPRPSTWYAWHEFLIRPGTRVLDLACGEGRHALAAARRGAHVVAVDAAADRLNEGRRHADEAGLTIDWRQADLTKPWPELGIFDAVLVFNYLDRARMPQILDCVAPGGLLMMETFLVAQRDFGWGPVSDDHLLHLGELAALVAPLEIVHGREVYEPVDAERWRAVAGVVAERSGTSPQPASTP